MSKITYNKILAKLARLDEYLGYLEIVQKAQKKEFLADVFLFGIGERYLQLAIEVILDVGKLFILSLDLKRPDSNQEIFDILFEKKLITSGLHARMAGIVGFRNVLVYDYEKLDREIVYENLKKNLKDFKDYKREIVRTLKRVM